MQLPAHAVPRIIVGPLTNEIIIGLGRIHDLGIKFTESDVVELCLSKRRANGAVVYSKWPAYVVDSAGQAHFQIPTRFYTDCFEFGFYKAVVMLRGCELADLEFIFPKSVHITCVDTADAMCLETDWQEPVCCVEPTQQVQCTCGCGGDRNKPCTCTCSIGVKCASCNKTRIIAQAFVNPSYAGLR